ncbi:V-type proton ATPase subunit S1-like [Micropterus salmoides]|uniref:V-type proton ATPase subunit S1-like n=1 Tax=Micropterus salmoides TaxID=27706 RepID=UPI0018EBE0BD|nr:V-type proton ATPase subunit S1-like [Micropterus salmoides]
MATEGTMHLHRISASLAVFLGLLSLLNTGNCDEQVPLILWTSEGISLPSQSPPTAGHIVEQQQLASYLEKAVNVGPRNVVLFLQDKVHTF